jgi:hypothetical protein
METSARRTKPRMEFEAVWALIQKKLPDRTRIRNWTRDSDYIGDDFDAIADPNKVTCFIPARRTVLAKDFEKVYRVWRTYLRGSTPRITIGNMTQHSKYIISILHYVMPRG